MEEKNELNDIILNKSGSGSNSKKLLLAIATLTLVLIIVLVIMNSLKTEGDEQHARTVLPPEPSAPTEIIDDPLFEPVEVIEEETNASSQDLGEIAQKIKQESFDNAPVQETVIEPAPAVSTRQAAPAVQSKPSAAAPAAAPKVQPKPAPKPVQQTVNTPTIKTAKPVETAKAAAPVAKTAPKPVAKAPATPAAPKAVDVNGTYFIQVGSFTKEPSKTLFDRLNASGLKYTTVPSGSATKVLVGPFQGEKAAREVLGTVRKNIESGAYIVKG